MVADFNERSESDQKPALSSQRKLRRMKSIEGAKVITNRWAKEIRKQWESPRDQSGGKEANRGGKDPWNSEF